MRGSRTPAHPSDHSIIGIHLTCAPPPPVGRVDETLLRFLDHRFTRSQKSGTKKIARDVSCARRVLDHVVQRPGVTLRRQQLRVMNLHFVISHDRVKRWSRKGEEAIRHNGTKALTTEPTGAGRLAGGRFRRKTWKNACQDIHGGPDLFVEDLCFVFVEGRKGDTMSLVSFVNNRIFMKI